MTMTFATDTPASFMSGAIKAAIDEIRTVLTRRAHRLAYASLLEMDSDRLDDLGIDAGDVRDALTDPASAARRFGASRARHAMGPTRRTASRWP